MPLDDYVIERELGRNNGIVTSLAKDTSGSLVCVKELLPSADLKDRQLFEREAETLGITDYPQIPKLIEHEPGLYTVMDYVPGKNLAQLMEECHQFSEEDVQNIALQTLDVIDYLHGLEPPLIHREIKPSNLIRGEDGSVFVVDLASTRKVTTRELEGSTTIGTFGYAPVEQWMGEPGIKSPVYSLGATMFYLLSGLNPYDCVSDGYRLDVHEHLNASEGMKKLIHDMTYPGMPKESLEQRLDPDEVRNRIMQLEGKVVLAEKPTFLDRIDGYFERLPEHGLKRGLSYATFHIAAGIFSFHAIPIVLVENAKESVSGKKRQYNSWEDKLKSDLGNLLAGVGGAAPVLYGVFYHPEILLFMLATNTLSVAYLARNQIKKGATAVGRPLIELMNRFRGDDRSLGAGMSDDDGPL